MAKKKFYAVIRGRGKTPKIYTSWKSCKKVVSGYSNPKFKSFSTKKEAETYIFKNTGKGSKSLGSNKGSSAFKRKYYALYSPKSDDWCIYDALTPVKKKMQKKGHGPYRRFTEFEDAWDFALKKNNMLAPRLSLADESVAKDFDTKRFKKVCPICEKPHGSKGQACRYCRLRLNKYELSIAKCLALRKKFGHNIFEILEENPTWANCRILRKETKSVKRKVRRELNVSSLKSVSYVKWEDDYPPYINTLFDKRSKLRLQALSGPKLNPNIHYRCLGCNEEHITTYSDLNFGHNCVDAKSTGEVIVEDYLKEKVKFVTQWDTLRCLNPVTGRQMPYDIEIPKKKIIIEVHGKQHYEYIEFFHRTYEAFEYQQYKDSIKKEFALSKGYEFVEINYDDIDSDRYIDILRRVLK